MRKSIRLSGKKCHGHFRWLLPMFYKAKKIYGIVALQTRRLKGKPKGQVGMYEIWLESLPGIFTPLPNI